MIDRSLTFVLQNDSGAPVAGGSGELARRSSLRAPQDRTPELQRQAGARTVGIRIGFPVIIWISANGFTLFCVSEYRKTQCYEKVVPYFTKPPRKKNKLFLFLDFVISMCYIMRGYSALPGTVLLS
jgi:hypothetical protein